MMFAKSWLKLDGIGLNSPLQTSQNRSHIDLDLKGKLKVTISYNKTPKDHTSDL